VLIKASVTTNILCLYTVYRVVFSQQAQCEKMAKSRINEEKRQIFFCCCNRKYVSVIHADERVQ
jgi:hypothetical protein